MIAPGSKLPLDLQLKAVVNGKNVETTLSALIQRPTVLSIYMRNNTSACDKQTASLAESADAIGKLGWNVIAVSRDTCASHGKYAAKLKLPFVLVSDPDDAIAKAADAIIEKSMYGKKYLGPARAAFFVDAKGKVLAVIPKLDPAGHGAEVLETIRTLKA
jgi:thioredoxin-dependent peroxiredoxin